MENHPNCRITNTIYSDFKIAALFFYILLSQIFFKRNNYSMKKVFIPFPFFVLFLSLLTITAFGQKQTSIDIAQRYIEQQAEQWDLTQVDIANPKVSDLYSSRHNGLTHVFFAQQHENIPVYNAITGIHITTEGKVFYATNGFLPKLASSINTTSPTISAHQAIEFAALNYCKIN